MAPELRKRKSKTNVAEPVVKKVEKVTKRKAAEESSPVAPKKHKPVKAAAKPKKQTETEVKADVETEVAAESAPTVKEKKKVAKKVKIAEPKEEPKETVVESAEEAVIPFEDDASEDDGEVDAELQALAAGLDSDSEETGQTDKGSDFKTGQDVGKIPKLSKKEKKALAASKNAAKDEPGVIYVGRLPHGFYEHELRSYFNQFGPVTKLRLSRNKHTGKSKHYAFIEFKSESDADIAARTMNSYLLFGHILRVKLVPRDQLHADIWKGANRRFKKTPWGKIMGNRLARPLSESAWVEKISREEKRRLERAEKLKELGYEFEAPALKQAPAPAALEAVAAEGAEEGKAVEAAPAVEDATAVATMEEAAAVGKPKVSKAKGKKAKKAKA
ncbi:hypothetical protein VDGD_06981 [Verticillium dahliae]|nr:hypothetical protein VDGD_06981 [Verticillium dahliae]